MRINFLSDLSFASPLHFQLICEAAFIYLLDCAPAAAHLERARNSLRLRRSDPAQPSPKQNVQQLHRQHQRQHSNAF